MKQRFYSNGKLLLTGEYAVLDGALALAIPTTFGQSLEIESANINGIHWESFDDKNDLWFKGDLEIDAAPNDSLETSGIISNRLLLMLQQAKKMNPSFLEDANIVVTTRLDFPRNWGLGTSSTLINNIAQWAQVDAFTLLKKSFGGSGYDIAAAQSEVPILYKIKSGTPEVSKISLPWNFTEKLYFIHLNQKQDSKDGIARYKKKSVNKKHIEEISQISQQAAECGKLDEFEDLLNSHERIISRIIGLPTVKERLFKDYLHTIKSLGAWGGDFVLATGTNDDMEYFKKKGYSTIIPFEEMIKPACK